MLNVRTLIFDIDMIRRRRFSNSRHVPFIFHAPFALKSNPDSMPIARHCYSYIFVMKLGIVISRINYGTRRQ